VKLLFIGSKPLGLRTLETLLRVAPQMVTGAVTLDDSADPRTVLPQLQEFCAMRKLPLFIATGRKHSEAIIREQQPDLCFVSGWYWMLDPEILTLVPRGFIGIHFSLLPKYRGGSPLVWQIINGEPEVGLSMFSFTEGVDAGGIWAQERVELGPDDYISDALARLESKSVAMIESKMPAILSGELQPSRQDDSQATYCSVRQSSDGEIRWDKSAAEIYNFVRAQSRPYPGAFTFLAGEQVIVWRARREKVTYYGRPGQVARVSREGVWVICGDSQPVILETAGWRGSDVPASEVFKSITMRLPSMAPPAK
jgi:methionyl-tRNA formyltransferase